MGGQGILFNLVVVIIHKDFLIRRYQDRDNAVMELLIILLLMNVVMVLFCRMVVETKLCKVKVKICLSWKSRHVMKIHNVIILNLSHSQFDKASTSTTILSTVFL